ncbi:MAG: trigger factor [Clostridia bacterium]|nr:trigger factor [Clostridia bacterium]
MAKVKVNNLETNRVELEFSVDKATFDKACSDAYKKNVKSINIPGFRKGKAPRSVIEKMYGKGVFYEDALNAILPEATEAAVKEAAIKPVSAPEYDVDKIDEEGVVVKAKFYVYPTVEVKEYKGIKVERNVKNVTATEVNEEIKRVQQRNARTIEVTDRAAKKDDTVTIDYEGFVDGVAFEGGKGEGHPLKLGSGQFIPGFEDQIIGHKIGDEFDVEVTFPEEYHAEDLKGKPAVFKTKIHAIKYEELPKLDDEFAKDVSEFDTLAEYKADVKAKLVERNEKAADAEVENALVEALVNNLEGEVPEVMIANEAENMVRDYDYRLRSQGLDLNTYFQYTGQNLDTLREQFKPQAQRQVKSRLALEKIAEVEAIKATDEEVEEEYNKLATMYGLELDKVKELVDADSVSGDIAIRKTVDFVKSNASITAKKKTTKKAAEKAEGEATEEKKPAAKKTTAKKSCAKKTTKETEDK